MKKLIALLLTISMLFGVTATVAGCSGGSKQLGDGDDVVIEFQLDNLGYGTQWLQESCERFMEQQKDVEYPGGKKGVYCHIVRGRAPSFNNVNTTAAHVVFGGGRGNAAAETGNVWNLNDVVTKMEIPGEPGVTIEDKIYPETRTTYRTEDTYDENGVMTKQGDYYVIPTHEIYAGFTYDKTVFDNYGFYFARTLDGTETTTGDPNFSVTDYYDEFGTNTHVSKFTNLPYEFVTAKPSSGVEEWEKGKSCGPNGIYGDYDDGLASSLYELFVMWEYMAINKVNPVIVSGFQQSLSNALLDSLPSSLMGYEKARGQFDLTGPVDAVVNFSYDAIEKGINYIEAPIVQRVNVTEESGYYTTWAVEKYFTMAAMELLVAEGYLDPASYPGTAAELNHLGAQKQFIDSGHQIMGGVGREIGMLMEYSYWWNESTIRGNVDAFKSLNQDVTDREVRWMPFSVNIKTTVTGEDEEVSYKFTEQPGISFSHTGTEYTESKKGEVNLLAQTSNNGLFVNKKTAEASEAEKQAIIDWLLFFHTESELSKVTASAGFRKALQYEMQEEDISKWPSFYKDLYDLSNKSKIIRLGAENETYAKSPAIFGRGEGNMAWQCKHSHFFSCYRKTPNKAEDRSSRRCFIYICITKDEWKTYYRGGQNIDRITSLNYPNGQEIIFVDGDDSKPI